MSEAPTATQVPVTTVRFEGSGHRMGWKGRLACAFTAASVLVGAYAAVDERFGWPRVPDLGDIFGGEAEPGQVETEQVTRESFRTVAEYDINCKATISAGIGVKGDQDYVTDWKLFKWTTGSGKADKRIYGDGDLCGETGSVIANAIIEGENITANGQTTTKVTKVTTTTDGLKPHRMRINHQMWQNCVPERFGDSAATVKKKQDEWQNSDKKSCDSGFDTSGLPGDAVASIKDMAFTAAQTGLAISDIPREVLDRQNGRLKADLESRLQQMYPDAQVTVNVVPRPEDDLQSRINAEVDNLRRNHYQVMVVQQLNPETGGVETILKLVAPGGTKMDVKAGSSVAGDFSLSDFRQRSEQTMPAPTTVNTVQRKAA